MKLKKTVIFAVILAVIASTLISYNLLKPSQTEAFMPGWESFELWFCCSDYAHTCPDEVHEACLRDCMNFGDCNQQN